MTLPTFLVIGAAKSGTTALTHYLRQHPDVYMSPVKGCNFFAVEGARVMQGGPIPTGHWIHDINDYRAQFEAVKGERAIGEASESYLSSPQAPARIRHYIPDAKLIAMLRNPVDRAYSSFMHLVRDGSETELDFRAALRLEEERAAANWGGMYRYREVGLYHGQLGRYFDLFAREQMAVYLYDDFESDPAALMRGVFGFLGVDEAFNPDMSQRPNVSGFHRSRLLQRAFTRTSLPRRVARRIFPPPVKRTVKRQLKKRVVKRPLDPAVRAELQAYFRDDILRLQDLLGRDLSAWLG